MTQDADPVLLTEHAHLVVLLLVLLAQRANTVTTSWEIQAIATNTAVLASEQTAAILAHQSLAAHHDAQNPYAAQNPAHHLSAAQLQNAAQILSAVQLLAQLPAQPLAQLQLQSAAQLQNLAAHPHHAAVLSAMHHPFAILAHHSSLAIQCPLAKTHAPMVAMAQSQATTITITTITTTDSKPTTFISARG